jgi:hypothetical protein
MNPGGKSYVTASELIGAALESHELDSIRYVVDRDADPVVTVIGTIGNQDIEETARWSEIEEGYKPDVCETLSDKVDFLKKRTTQSLLQLKPMNCSLYLKLLLMILDFSVKGFFQMSCTTIFLVQIKNYLILVLILRDYFQAIWK